MFYTVLVEAILHDEVSVKADSEEDAARIALENVRESHNIDYTLWEIVTIEED